MNSWQMAQIDGPYYDELEKPIAKKDAEIAVAMMWKFLGNNGADEYMTDYLRTVQDYITQLEETIVAVTPDPEPPNDDDVIEF